MTKKRKNLLILGICLSAVVFYEINLWYSYFDSRLWEIEKMFVAYVQRTKGDFPDSEKDLINEGLLKVENDHGVKIYKILNAPFTKKNEIDAIWHRNRIFPKMKITYGIKLEKLKIVDGELYDKSTNKKTFLFSGPYKWLFPDKYRKISIACLNNRKQTN